MKCLNHFLVKWGKLIETYKIPQEIRDELKIQLLTLTQKLIKTYPENNPSDLYESLKELRYAATCHQLNTWQKYPKKYRDGLG